MSTTPDEYPEFRTVLRGHDPAQVEEVLDELYGAIDASAQEVERWAAQVETERARRQQLERALGEAKARIDELERQPARSDGASFEALGHRVAAILETAEKEAAEMTQTARDEAQRLHWEARGAREEATRDAQRILDEARNAATMEATTLVDDAQAQAQRISDEIEQRRQAAADDAVRLVDEAKVNVERIEAQGRERHEVLTQHHGVVRDHLAEVNGALKSLLASGTDQEHAQAEAVPAEQSDPADSADSADVSEPAGETAGDSAAETQVIEAAEVIQLQKTGQAEAAPEDQTDAVPPEQNGHEHHGYEQNGHDQNGHEQNRHETNGHALDAFPGWAQGQESAEDDGFDDSFVGEPWNREAAAQRR